VNVPLSEPDITDLEIDAVVAVMRGSRLSLGPQMEAFENAVAAYTDMPHAIAVSSGTAGLHLCVRALGIGPGDEVIVPSFTFIAAANTVQYEGAIPVFVDIEQDTFNLDPACVEAAITPRTRAIMVVHTFGCPAEMDRILDIAQRHGLYVIEDACEAIGAEFHGRRVGSFGHAAVFAFYPNKQITTGEGGIVVTRDDGLAREMRALRNQGRYDSDEWHQHAIVGYNYRLSELSCALGLAQMTRIDEILAKRQAVAAQYHDLLRGCSELTLPLATTRHGRTSWFVYVVRLAGIGEVGRRDRILQALRARGIQCGRYFAPIHQQPAYANRPVSQPLPVTEAESLCTLALPFFSRLTASQTTYVADSLQRLLNQ
jgi:perosamine synthetase